MGMTMGHLGLRHTLARARGTKLELLRQRAKILAELEAKKKELTQLDAELDRLEEQAQHLQTALAAVYVDASTNIEPRQTFPKKRFTSWGGITRSILALFRAADGCALRKSEVAEFLRGELGLNFDTPAEEVQFRRYVQQSLKNMYQAGHLERLHAKVTGTEGLWRLKASSE